MTATPDPDTPTSSPVPVPELNLGTVPQPTRGDALEPAPDDAGDATTPPADGRRRVRARRMGAAAGAAAVIVLAVALLTSVLTSSASATHAPSPTTTSASGNRAQAARHRSAELAAATTAPAPAPPSLVNSAPLQSHEIFGYAPYWTLPQSSGFDVKDLTTLAYFSVDANADGTLDQSGPGWNGYESQDLVDLVTRSHAAGDRVVLTVTCFDQQSLDAITSDPNAPARLSAALIAAVRGKNLDGVNFDFEGEGSADQTGLTNLITKVSAALHVADPHWQVTMAVYASAAGDPHGFYNIAAIAPALDGFFVMAYDMNSKTQPSATSPLFGSNYSDVQAIESFLKVVPASKIVLGLPFYGYDWPTTGGTLPATATATGSESPLPYSAIKASGHPTYWDPVTDTPWTSYQVGTQWHTTYFDDPTSMALKAQLANYFHIAGVGIWALGMDGNDPAMLAALLGNAPAAKDASTGPPPGTGFVSVATFAGTTNVALTPITPPPPGGSAQLVGFLGGFATTDPPLACLATDPHISVWTFSALPGFDVAVATAPTDCVTAMFAFPVLSTTTTTTTPPASTPTTAPGATTTTTRPPSTTTTTTTRPPATTTTITTTTTTTTVP